MTLSKQPSIDPQSHHDDPHTDRSGLVAETRTGRGDSGRRPDRPSQSVAAGECSPNPGTQTKVDAVIIHQPVDRCPQQLATAAGSPYRATDPTADQIKAELAKVGAQ